jgi:hypothetical protein
MHSSIFQQTPTNSSEEKARFWIRGKLSASVAATAVTGFVMGLTVLVAIVIFLGVVTMLIALAAFAITLIIAVALVFVFVLPIVVPMMVVTAVMIVMPRFPVNDAGRTVAAMIVVPRLAVNDAVMVPARMPAGEMATVARAIRRTRARPAPVAVPRIMAR